jgi:hypothetical protein
MVFAFAVGGFVMAANIYGDQDHSPPDDVQQIVKDYFDPAETAPLQTSRTSGFVMESEIHSHSYWAFSKSFILTLQTKTLTPIKTSRSMPQLASNLNGIDVHQIQYHMPFYNLERSYDEATLK